METITKLRGELALALNINVALCLLRQAFANPFNVTTVVGALTKLQ